MVAAAVAGAAAVVGAGASMAAANKQSKAANSATNLQEQIYQQNQANLSPYMQQGNAATSKLSDLLGTSGNTSADGYGSLTSGFTAQDYLNNQDPGYAFQLNQGQQALQNSQAAQNGVLSGSAMKDLVAYNQNYASTGYQNAYNRWNTNNTNTYNRLAGLSSLGENAAATAGNQGIQSGSNIASSLTGSANASASGLVGATNSLTSGASNLAGYYYMNNLLSGSSGSNLNLGSVNLGGSDSSSYLTGLMGGS